MRAPPMYIIPKVSVISPYFCWHYFYRKCTLRFTQFNLSLSLVYLIFYLVVIEVPAFFLDICADREKVRAN